MNDPQAARSKYFNAWSFLCKRILTYIAPRELGHLVSTLTNGVLKYLPQGGIH